VDGITTTCGFLSLYQDRLSAGCGVPVATSPLMQIPLAAAVLPREKRVGVITFSAADLAPAHLVAAGAPGDTPVVGLAAGCAFDRHLRENGTRMDRAACQADLQEAAGRLCKEHVGIGAIVLECANMAPFAAGIGRATGLPVYSVYSFVTWFQAGLRPRVF
jgi:Asp/Glu/hydantoin racemase